MYYYYYYYYYYYAFLVVFSDVGVCSVSGDPHYRFFDACGKKLDFMGVCTYLLSESTVVGNNLLSFSCKVQNHKRRNPKGRPSWTDYVVCTVDKYTIKLGQKKTVEVRTIPLI